MSSGPYEPILLSLQSLNIIFSADGVYMTDQPPPYPGMDPNLPPPPPYAQAAQMAAGYPMPQGGAYPPQGGAYPPNGAYPPPQPGYGYPQQNGFQQNGYPQQPMPGAGMSQTFINQAKLVFVCFLTDQVIRDQLFWSDVAKNELLLCWHWIIHFTGHES